MGQQVGSLTKLGEVVLQKISFKTEITIAMESNAMQRWMLQMKINIEATGNIDDGMTGSLSLYPQQCPERIMRLLSI